MSFRRSDVPGEDIKLFMSMADRRRQLIDESPATPINFDYGVNRLAKQLHPGIIKAKIVDKKDVGVGCQKITLMSKSDDGTFPYFRAGQFIAVSSKVSDSFITRPYSIASAPWMALAGLMEIIVQKKGIFSSYLVDDLKMDDEVYVSEPAGDFYHDDIRDKGHVLAIAGGSGVTPFVSMMRAIMEGIEDYSLTLLYGVRTPEYMVIDPDDFKDDRIKIIPVVSEGEYEGYRHGFIDADLIEKYLDDDTSVFMCGPDSMYAHVRKQLEELGYPLEKVRQERNTIGNREVKEFKTCSLTVHIRDKVYDLEARNDETIMTAMERAGLAAPSRCRNGTCGFCHSRVISGQYHVSTEDDFRRAADKKFNYIHPCCTYPESDMEIDVPYFEV